MEIKLTGKRENKIVIILNLLLVLFVMCLAYPAYPGNSQWTLKTDDTKLSISIGSDKKLYINELSNPIAGWNWIKSPSVFPLPDRIVISGKDYQTDWKYKNGVVDTADGTRVIIHFFNVHPSLELTICWQARSGPGPIRQTISLRNNSGHTVTVYNQESIDLQIVAPESNADLWYFNDMGWSKIGYGGESGEAMFHDKLVGGYSKVLNFSDQSGYMPYIVVDAAGKKGVYLGCEWIFGRISINTNKEPRNVHLRAGNGDNFKTDIDDGEVFDFPPAFIGAYKGDLDDAGNSLRQYLYNYSMPAVIRTEGYPKVQLNAFASFAEKPHAWNPIQDKFFSTVDLISSMGFEEIMFDVGWWEGNTKILPAIPKFDPVDWSMGPIAIGNYLAYKNIRWGLYWDRPAKMSSNFGILDRINQIKYMYDNWKIDVWRSDGTAGALITQGTWNADVTKLTYPEGSFGIGTRAHYAEDLNYWQCKGFYEVVDNLYANIPNFQWENCEGGGQITDFGSMSRCVKIQMADSYTPLDMHRSFYDHLYMFHPIQLQGLISAGEGNRKYWFRSAFMGAGNLTIDVNNCSPQERNDITACVNSYKTKIRPLFNSAYIKVFHILPRANNHVWTGMEYYEPTKQKGVVYIFKPDNNENTQTIKLKGLNTELSYKLTFEDGTNPDIVLTGKELMQTGVNVSLKGKFISELMFFEKSE